MKPTVTSTTANPLITTLKNAKLLMRSIAVMVVFFHTFLILSPAAAAMRDEIDKEDYSTRGIETELSTSYIEAIENLALLKQLRLEDKDTDVVMGELKALKVKLEDLNAQVTENFILQDSALAETQFPESKLKQQSQLTAHYKTKNKAFMALLDKETKTGFVADAMRGIHNLIDDDKVIPNKPLQGNSATRVSDGKYVFKTSDFKRSQQAFDPNNMGTQSLQADENNKPKTTHQQFINSGLRNSPLVTLSALGDFKYDGLEGASDPLYLAESDEVQLTQSIKDKAAELEYDTVKIYHWVRNNIEWLPSWGGIQDAELTLEAKRGNAMDIASLTISLLRASQIPARYVHGTIDVPPEDFKNWAGGFTTKEAAGDYASSGGIPLTLQTTNYADGKSIQTMRLEHVWVEAATDFQPSRGAVNYDADTWVQLDPSFKQYEYQEGLDVVAISGLDMDKLAQDFVDSGTVNEAEGWATGFDPSILQAAQTQAQEKLEAHIATLDNPTVGDVIGGKKTIIKEYPALPSSLPNRIVIVGTRYDKLPSALQQKIEFALGADFIGEMIDPITFPFAKLNNEKVNLSFKPTTQADEDALAALIPDGITDVNELPTSIPNSIRVIPELKINGVVVKTGTSLGLGEEVSFVTGIRFAGRGYVRTPRTYKVIAGSFLNVNVFAGSVSRVKMEKLYTKLEETKNVLASGDELKISALTKDEVLGDMFYAGSLGYYSQLITLAHIKAKYTNNFFQLAVGYGTIGYEPRVNSFFGQPRGIRNGGIAFDIPMIQVVANSDGNLDLVKQFAMSVGVESSTLEHVIPEQMFAPVDPTEPRLDGISAVKALQKAGLEGQKIYLITKDNRSQILPLINFDAETRNEVTRALNAGKHVTAHPNKVSVPGGWSGFGYIITDPVVGDGVYKISGGANGSDVNLGDLTGIFTTMGAADDMRGFANLSRLSSLFSGIMSFFTLSDKGCGTFTSVIGGIISTALNWFGSSAIAAIGFSSMIPLLQIIFWVVLLSVILILLTMLINDLIGLTCSVMIKIKRLKKLIPSNSEARVFV